MVERIARSTMLCAVMYASSEDIIKTFFGASELCAVAIVKLNAITVKTGKSDKARLSNWSIRAGRFMILN